MGWPSKPFEKRGRANKGDAMSVRKRTWTTSKGEEKEAWIVDYRDKASGDLMNDGVNPYVAGRCARGDRIIM